MIACGQGTEDRFGKAEVRKLNIGQWKSTSFCRVRISFVARLRSVHGRFPGTGRGRHEVFLLMCSRELMLHTGSNSRYRETINDGRMRLYGR